MLPKSAHADDYFENMAKSAWRGILIGHRNADYVTSGR
jgi:hypothetical protein